jgi:DNA-binding NarL/FixJ family response regulator
MNVLMVNTGNFVIEELSEIVNELEETVYAADSHEEAVGILTIHPIDVAIFTLRTFVDLELLHYLNTSHPQIRVLLSVGDPLNNIVSILRDGCYQVLPTSCRLSALRRSVEAIIRPQEPKSQDCS